MSKFERMTWRTTVGTPNFDMNDEIRKDNIARSAFYQKVCDRLAAYEDSGLSPEEVQELAQAKADGRCVMLPCKVGSTIYRPEGLQYSWQIVSITTYLDEIIYTDDSDNIFRADDIGKTVFLTREEAEKALKGAKKEAQ